MVKGLMWQKGINFDDTRQVWKEDTKICNSCHWQHFSKSYLLTPGSYGTIPTDGVSVYKVIHHLIEGLDAHFH